MNALRAIQFAVTVLTIWGGSNWYMAARLIGPSPLTGAGRITAWGFAAVLAGAVPATLFGQRRWPAPRWLVWTAYLYMGFAASLLPLVVLRDLGWAAVHGLAALWALHDPGVWELLHVTRWPAWFNASSIVLLGLGLAATLTGFLEAHRRPASRNISIPIPGLPAALEGFRIAHVSDLHAGGTIARGRLEHVVREVNAFLPDLIALTGDLADGAVQELKDHVSPIADLRARHGVFFATGNHEYYWDPAGWLAHIATLGPVILLNEHRMLRHGDAEIMVGGVTDPTSHEHIASHISDPAAALAGAPASAFKLLLAHQPGSAFAAEKAGVDLQLSGHTHGGQFFPWTFLVKRVQPFLAGFYAVGRMRLYVSRGAGYWGPPNRLGVPAEIALLTLTRADQTA